MRKSNSREILDNESAAKLLGCQPDTIRKWANTGRIPAHKVGNKIIYLRSEIMEWLKTK
jgi:excisionase family DNA binding protein